MQVIETRVIREPSSRREGYHNFLNSYHWKKLRRQRLKKHNYCQICFSKENLNIHHYSYKNTYRANKKAIKDTTVLCRSCHQIVHDIQKERSLSFEETKPIIKELIGLSHQARSEQKQSEEDFYEMMKNIL